MISGRGKPGRGAHSLPVARAPAAAEHQGHSELLIVLAMLIDSQTALDSPPPIRAPPRGSELPAAPRSAAQRRGGHCWQQLEVCRRCRGQRNVWAVLRSGAVEYGFTATGFSVVVSAEASLLHPRQRVLRR